VNDETMLKQGDVMKAVKGLCVAGRHPTFSPLSETWAQAIGDRHVGWRFAYPTYEN